MATQIELGQATQPLARRAGDARGANLWLVAGGPRDENMPFVGRLLATALVPAGDALALALALALAGGPPTARLAFGVLAFLALRTERSSSVRLSLRVSEQLVGLLVRLGAAAVVVAWFTEAAHAVLHSLPVMIGSVLLVRLVTFSGVRAARARGVIQERTIIIGAGAVAMQCADDLAARPEYGLVPVGFVDGYDDDPEMGLPVLGDLRDLDAIVREFGVQRAVVAFGSHREHEMVTAIRACSHHGVGVYVVPRFFELGVCPDGAATDRIWGTRLIYARPPLIGRAGRVAKRAMDMSVAAFLLTLAAPFAAAISVAIKLASPGPILFRQWRVGRDGRSFELLKFRSMSVNSDSETTWSVEDDDRVTSVGRVLRRTSLDELPQLVNILRGDMSLVGPRPERAHFVGRFNETIEHYGDRHRARAGLSGWAQVHGLRGDTSIEERVQFDNDYIEHWNFWFDVVILFRTAMAVVRDLLPSHTGPPRENVTIDSEATAPADAT